MTKTQKERLIEALEIRMKQFEANFNGDDVKYSLMVFSNKSIL